MKYHKHTPTGVEEISFDEWYKIVGDLPPEYRDRVLRERLQYAQLKELSK